MLFDFLLWLVVCIYLKNLSLKQDHEDILLFILKFDYFGFQIYACDFPQMKLWNREEGSFSPYTWWNFFGKVYWKDFPSEKSVTIGQMTVYIEVYFDRLLCLFLYQYPNWLNFISFKLRLETINPLSNAFYIPIGKTVEFFSCILLMCTLKW